jgi:hypothetical protein
MAGIDAKSTGRFLCIPGNHVIIYASGVAKVDGAKLIILCGLLYGHTIYTPAEST